MNAISLILLTMTGLFASFLLIKGWLHGRFCVLCASVSLTWAVLLLLFWTGRFADPVIIAVLLGESVTGVTSLLASRVREEVRMFRLPFFLTATFVAWTVLGKTGQWLTNAGLLTALWLLFALLFAYRTQKKIRASVNRLIACCRDW